jgi:hypothetical protein
MGGTAGITLVPKGTGVFCFRKRVNPGKLRVEQCFWRWRHGLLEDP